LEIYSSFLWLSNHRFLSIQLSDGSFDRQRFWTNVWCIRRDFLSVSVSIRSSSCHMNGIDWEVLIHICLIHRWFRKNCIQFVCIWRTEKTNLYEIFMNLIFLTSSLTVFFCDAMNVAKNNRIKMSTTNIDESFIVTLMFCQLLNVNSIVLLWNLVTLCNKKRVVDYTGRLPLK
jgi:hypothetical protein